MANVGIMIACGHHSGRYIVKKNVISSRNIVVLIIYVHIIIYCVRTGTYR